MSGAGSGMEVVAAGGAAVVGSKGRLSSGCPDLLPNFLGNSVVGIADGVFILGSVLTECMRSLVICDFVV